MKSTLLCTALCLFFLVMLSTALIAQTQFRQGDWLELLGKAKTENKLIFVDAYTTWCTWCKEMDKENFTDSIVGLFMNEHYIPVRLDMEEGLGLKMAIKYRVNAFPTFLVFTSDGQLVRRVMGYRKKDQFLKELNEYLLPANHQPAIGVSQEWNLNYPEFYVKSFGKNGTRVNPDTSVVINWLDSQPDLFNELSWSVLWRFHSNEKYQRHFLENINTYYDLYGSVEVQDKLESVYYRQLAAAIKSKKEENFKQLLKDIETYQRENVFEMKSQYQLFYYEKMENWAGFAATLETYIQQKGYQDQTTYINNHCWTLYEQAKDTTIIHSAVNWMKNVTDIEPNYMFLDTYAALLYKDKQFLEAEKIAAAAIEAGKKENSPIRETEILLEKIKVAVAAMNR